MVQIRLIRFRRSEFRREIYRPGVISLSRIVWGSVGGGLLLLLIGIFSIRCRVGVLYPPLAATCFISTSCVYLRVARVKSVIVGHFIAAVGGLLGVHAGEFLVGGTQWLLPVKLGLAVLLASVFMQILDADHPPAAATAAIPAILPLPVSELVLPLHMAWGGIIAVVFGVIWNRVWFEYPAPAEDVPRLALGVNMSRPDMAGCAICLAGFVLMCLRALSEGIYVAGLWIMLAGVLVLSTHQFFGAVVVRGGRNHMG
ncbi:MAG: HPP family protein [Desulfobacterales bacterium]|nr:HPP family protein [Desulfobacterales bacterium]